MTKRIHQPDTQADTDLKECLSQNPPRSFIMKAGAGSGKTTSLVKALSHLETQRGSHLRQRGQKIACITYTEVAVEEIQRDVGTSGLFHISTIHSFLWILVKPFHKEIRLWVRTKLESKIIEAQDKLNKPRTRNRTKYEADIHRYKQQINSLDFVERFTYGTGSRYSEGILGHTDILDIGPYLIKENPLMQQIVASRFPFIFIDESQDTDQAFIEALCQVDTNPKSNFSLGFFGDPMQKIYPGGAGSITLQETWSEITKTENFRCPSSILRVINNIRAEGDRMEQVAGRTCTSFEGTARVFILPNNNDRTEQLSLVRSRQASKNNDLSWEEGEVVDEVRTLVLVHRAAAHRLGFSNLYAALNDKAPTNLQEGFLDGTVWVVKPFLTYILPLVTAHRDKRTFDVMTFLRKNCPQVSKEQLASKNTSEVLRCLSEDVQKLETMFAFGPSPTVRYVISFIKESQLYTLDERFDQHLVTSEAIDEAEDTDAVKRYLDCPATELWGYQNYLEGYSPFATQQGVKGAEYPRVLVVLDDEESNHNSFSYEKYFGIKPPSDTDMNNQQEGKETVIDRTRRLFYVCCSRATKDLAVVFFVSNVAEAKEAILHKEIFAPDEIYTLEDL